MSKPSKKDRYPAKNNSAGPDSFHVPRNLNIELDTTKIEEYDLLQLRYYTEYQWLVDFSLYAGIVYILSEVYHFYFPLKDEVNLSMMWCFLVVFFALYVLLHKNRYAPIKLSHF